METTKLIITPKTKVMDVIENYPQLEAALINYVPAFEKLKNPILRRTVGKIATLQQAAIIGNVAVSDLVNFLRKEIGQDEVAIAAEQTNYNFERTAWFNEVNIVNELDAREMLARGEHPVAQVMEDLKKLNGAEIYKLTASFLPAPLIDKAIGLNYSHWIEKQNDELFHIYFTKTNS